MTLAKSPEPGPDALTQAQQRRAGQRAVDQDRTLLAMHQLEAALGAAGGSQAGLGLRSMWIRTVVPACPVLIST